MNRRGDLGSGILFFAFFLIAVMIGGGLVGGIFAFYGEGYDFRQAESQVLVEKVWECYLENSEEILKDDFDSDKLYDFCDLDKGVIGDGNHMVLIKDNSKNKEIVVGVNDFRNRCFFVGAEENRDFPLCAKRESGDIEIIAGSSQNSRSVAS